MSYQQPPPPNRSQPLSEASPASVAVNVVKNEQRREFFPKKETNYDTESLNITVDEKSDDKSEVSSVKSDSKKSWLNPNAADFVPMGGPVSPPAPLPIRDFPVPERAYPAFYPRVPFSPYGQPQGVFRPPSRDAVVSPRTPVAIVVPEAVQSKRLAIINPATQQPILPEPAEVEGSKPSEDEDETEVVERVEEPEDDLDILPKPRSPRSPLIQIRPLDGRKGDGLMSSELTGDNEDKSDTDENDKIKAAQAMEELQKALSSLHHGDISDDEELKNLEDLESEDEEVSFTYEIEFMMSLKSQCNDLPADILTQSECLKKAGVSKVKHNRAPGPKHRRFAKDKRGKDIIITRKAELKPLDLEGGWKHTMPSDEKEELTRKATNILNKLTMQSFGKLSQKLMEVVAEYVSDPETLRIVVKLAFDKALIEPNFAHMYADLCMELHQRFPSFTVPVVDESGNTKEAVITFKSILLRQCQVEFYDGMKELEFPGDIANDEKELIKSRQKSRWLGNIVLIGELYKRQMVASHILIRCLKKLTQTNLLEDFEAACKLLTNVGSMFDKDHKTDMDHIAAIFETLQKNSSVPSRIRFLMLDVLDLRKNHWNMKSNTETHPEEPHAAQSHNRSNSFVSKNKDAPLKNVKPGKAPVKKFVRPVTTPKSQPKPLVPKAQDSAPVEDHREEKFSDVSKETVSMAKGYAKTLDLAELAVCVSELKGEKNGNPDVFLPDFVSKLVFELFEARSNPEPSVIRDIVSNRDLMSKEHMIEGLQHCLSRVSEMLPDYPKLRSFIVSLVSSLVAQSTLEIYELSALWDYEAFACGIMSEILEQSLSEVLAHKEIDQLRNDLTAAKFDLSLFIYDGFADSVLNFIQKHDDDYKDLFDTEKKMLTTFLPALRRDKTVRAFDSSNEKLMEIATRLLLEQILLSSTYPDKDMSSAPSEDQSDKERKSFERHRDDFTVIIRHQTQRIICLNEIVKLGLKLDFQHNYLARVCQNICGCNIIQKRLLTKWIDTDYIVPCKTKYAEELQNLFEKIQ